MKTLIAIVLVLLGINLQGQVNLVPNPSFELCDSICNSMRLGQYIPSENKYFYFLQNWYSAKATPDYFSINSVDTVSSGCWGGGKVNIPNSPVGYQYARTDSHYVGLAVYYHQAQNSWAGHNYNYREWIGVRLLQPLKQGVCYEFTMYVSRGEKSNRIVSSIGAYFTADSLFESYPSTPPYYISPWPLDSSQVQVQHNPWETIYDTVNWIPITGAFKAQGGEQYMYIGNLLKDEQYPIVEIDTLENNDACQLTYFFIDDVSLYEIEENCAVGITENSIKPGINIYPNPTTGNLSIELKQPLNKAYIELFDAMGRFVYSAPLSGSITTLALPALPNGVYHARVWNNNAVIKQEKVVVY